MYKKLHKQLNQLIELKFISNSKIDNSLTTRFLSSFLHPYLTYCLVFHMISKDKRKQSKNKNHFKAPYEDEEENLLVQTLSLLEALFELRLVQKISRPLDKKNKQQLLNTYGQKLETLHNKLNKIRKEINQNNTVSQTVAQKRNKSVFGQATTKPDNWKKVIRNIQNKYTETFIDGSFKHYKKIVLLLGLNSRFNMELVNIEEWSAACLDNRTNGNCC